MNDPWTWATGWGLTVGAGGETGRGEQRREKWDNCNRTKIKYLIKKELQTSDQEGKIGKLVLASSYDHIKITTKL